MEIKKAVQQWMDLGFYSYEAPNTGTQGGGYNLQGLQLPPNQGRRFKGQKDYWWEIGSWLIIAVGVFAGQAISFEKGITFDLDKITWLAVGAAFAFALALFPVFMRKVN